MSPVVTSLIELLLATGSKAVNQGQAFHLEIKAALAAFLAAFFCRRGNRGLFLFASFAIFGFAGFEGFATPTAVATFPAASPMVLAAFTKVPSGGVSFAGSAGISVASFFFGMPAYSTVRDSPPMVPAAGS